MKGLFSKWIYPGEEFALQVFKDSAKEQKSFIKSKTRTKVNIIRLTLVRNQPLSFRDSFHLNFPHSMEEKKKGVEERASSSANFIKEYCEKDSSHLTKRIISENPVIPPFPLPPPPLCIVEEKKKEYVVPVSFADLKIDYSQSLGEGAYGKVYQGTYRYEDVAIKKLNAKHLGEDARKELEREAEIMASIRSRYLVQLHDVCLEPPHFCLVMELMPKGSLYNMLKNNCNLPLLNIYRIALDVGYGLCLLHENGIIHRDLKSLNVLLDDHLRAKICDFGLAKVKAEAVSTMETKEAKGTLGWMAPELFDYPLPPPDPTIDIYAFGMILWELAIKPYKVPFNGLALNVVMAAKAKRGLEQEAVPNDCELEFAKLMRHCWQAPQERPSAKSLVDSLYQLFKAAESKEIKGLVEAPTKKMIDLVPTMATSHCNSR